MAANDVNRRLFLQRAVAHAGALSVCQFALATHSLATTDKLTVSEWLTDIDAASAKLRAKKISEAVWQQQMAMLSQQLPLSDIAAAIDFEQVSKNLPFADKGVNAKPVRFAAWGNEPLTVYPKIFAVGKGRAIIPHGHRGMVSGHLVLQGGFHLRQYDVHHTSDQYWELSPTIDRHESAGGFSTISDQQNNAHWLIATEDSYTLDFIIAPTYSETSWTVQNLDLDNAEKTANGHLLVPTLAVGDALKKYG